MKLNNVAELSESDSLDLLRQGPYLELHQRFGHQGSAAGVEVTKSLVELVCPELQKSPGNGSGQPLSFVVNCGMPDQSAPGGPADHLANGVFFDRLGGSELMNLDFLLEKDGLETTLMLSENLDAGQVFDSQEHQTGFVWIDSFVDRLPQRDRSRLLGINETGDGLQAMRTARPSSFHPGGVNVAFCDGSTFFLNEEVDYLAFVHYMTSAGQEVKVPGTQKPADEPYRLIGIMP